MVLMNRVRRCNIPGKTIEIFPLPALLNIDTLHPCEKISYTLKENVLVN